MMLGVVTGNLWATKKSAALVGQTFLTVRAGERHKQRPAREERLNIRRFELPGFRAEIHAPGQKWNHRVTSFGGHFSPRRNTI